MMIATKGYGFTLDMIDWSSPADMKPYLKAHNEEIKEKDYLAWLSNQYTMSAVSVAVEHCLAGRKAKSEYIKQPFLLEGFEVTEGKKQEKEIKKAILTEQWYIEMANIKNLPKTVIK